MPYITAAVLAGTAIYGAVEANDRKQDAKKALDELKKKQPKYRSAADIQQEAESAVPYGYTPSERANFQQSMTRRANAANRLATDRNPNLSNAINAGINYGNIQGNLAFAADDSRLRQSKIRDYVGRITGQSNAQTQADITSKLQQEIAYGNAKQQANADIYNSIMQLGYASTKLPKNGSKNSYDTTTNGAIDYNTNTGTNQYAPPQENTAYNYNYQNPYNYQYPTYGTPPMRNGFYYPNS